MKSENLETHHFLPSGEWEGFYCYSSPQQHKMSIELTFKNGRITGGGIDDVNTFSWQGNYNIETFTLTMMKNYPTHQIYYKGNIDENGIWGMWEGLGNYGYDFRGGFHIWPKKVGNESEEEAAEEVTASEKLKEILIKGI